MATGVNDYGATKAEQVLTDSNTPKAESSADETTVKMCLDLFEQARQARASVDADWPKRWDFYTGKQWDAKRPAYRAKPVLNIIRETIQAMLPLLTDNRPGFNVIPAEPSDYEFATIMSDLEESWWDKADMDHTLIEWIMDSMVFDAGILKVVWDPTAEDNAGDVAVSVVNPSDLYVPFGARDFTKDCSYVVQRCVKTVGELRAQFPDKAHLIKCDSEDQSNSNIQNNMSTDTILVSPVDKKGPSELARNSQPDQRKTSTVYEFWLDDETTEQQEITNEDGTKETQTKKTYPNGRLITIQINGKVLLQDTANPYKHKRKPFVRLVDKILPRQFWGEGECKVLMDQQRIINKVMGNVIDYTTLMANPTWLTENGNGVDPEKLTNAYAQIIQVQAGKLNTIKRDVPPAMQSGMLDLLQFMLNQGQRISGVTEMSQGRSQQGVTAAAAIQSLQEAAQTRIRLMERNMGVSLGQLGYQVMSLMMQFYTEPRVARITNKENTWPKYFEFFVEDNGDGTVKYNKRDYNYDEPTKRYTPGDWQTGETKGVMDIKVLAGTSLPFAKTQRANVAFRLYDSKAIDVEELLDALDWPNKEKLMERLRQSGVIPDPEAEQQPPQGGQPGQPLPAGPGNAGQLPPPGAGVTQGA